MSVPKCEDEMRRFWLDAYNVSRTAWLLLLNATLSQGVPFNTCIRQITLPKGPLEFVRVMFHGGRVFTYPCCALFGSFAHCPARTSRVS